jgi:hypothetical protein
MRQKILRNYSTRVILKIYVHCRKYKLFARALKTGIKKRTLGEIFCHVSKRVID